MNSRRIEYVCSDRGIPIDGDKGASVHFREMGRALVRSGLTVRTVVRRHLGRTVSDLPYDTPSRRRPRKSGGELPSAVKDLDQLFSQEDMVEILSAAPAPDALYERYSLFGLAGMRRAIELDIPFVLEVNAPLWEEAARYRDLGLVGLARSVARELFSRAAHILAVSPQLAQRLVEEGAPEDRVRAFPNGVSPAFLGPGPLAERPSAFADRPVLSFVGSLKPWHGVEFLLDAVTGGAAEDACLWVVGDGPLRERVEAAAKQHPDRVYFEGPVPNERVASILRASDASVAPYLSDAPHYFSPLKVVESLCAGTRLLASTVPAVEMAVPAPADVFWFEPGRAESFREAVRELLAAPARRPGSTAEGFDPQEYSWDARARELQGLLGWACVAEART